MTDTPRTSEEWRRIQRRPDGRYGSEITYQDLAHGMSNFAKQLERELAAVTEQRDKLAEALRELCETLLNDKPRDITESLYKAGDALAAWKGGSHDH